MKTIPASFQTKPHDADSERQPAITASRVEGTGSHIYVVGISLVAAIGGFLFGFDSGVVNGTVHALSVAFGTRAAATGLPSRQFYWAAPWALSARARWPTGWGAARPC